MSVKVYLEGGGDHNKALQTQCRKGFSDFFRRAGLAGRMPAVVACGGRSQAYKSFRIAHENAASGTFPILLVDSEAPVAASNAWEHVGMRTGDGWERPEGASADQLHLNGPGDGGLVPRG